MIPEPRRHPGAPGRSTVRGWVLLAIGLVVGLVVGLAVVAGPARAQAEGALLPDVLYGRTPAARALMDEALGPHRRTDPDRLGRIFRVGRDPTTCAQAMLNRLLLQRGEDKFLRAMAQELAGNAPRADRVLPHERAAAEMLLFQGRDAEAEDFLRQRLRQRIPDGVTPRDAEWAHEVRRRAMLEGLLARTVSERAGDPAPLAPERPGGTSSTPTPAPQTALPADPFARAVQLRERGALAGQTALALRLALETALALEDEFECMAQPTPRPLAAAREAALQRALPQVDSLMEGRLCEVRICGGAYVYGGPAKPATVLPVARMLDVATESAGLVLEAGLPHDARAMMLPVQGLAAVVLGDDHPITLRATAMLARSEAARGDFVAALAWWRAWRLASERFLDQRLWTVSEAQRRRFLAEDRAVVGAAVAAEVRHGGEEGARHLLALSTGRKGLLTRIAGDVMLRARSSPTTTGALPMLRQVEALRTRLAAMVHADAGSTPAALRLRRELAEAESRLSAAVRPVGPATAPPPHLPTPWPLPQDLVAVDFIAYQDSGQDRLVAVLVQPDGRTERLTWDDPEPLRRALVALHQAMADQPATAVHAAARHLSALLWQPIARRVAGARQLAIVPDAWLQLVPWHLLPHDEATTLGDQFFLIQRTDLRSARPAASPLVAPGSGAGHAVLLADPRYGGRASLPAGRRLQAEQRGGLRFDPLPGTRTEAIQVLQRLPAGWRHTLLLGDQASKQRLLAVRSPRLLHLATHGWYLDDPTRPEDAAADPLVSLARSGLALAGANDDGLRGIGHPQGLLSALEVSTLDLRDTALVVLSACETALGQTTRGDGLYGLVRAFHEAGAQQVLGTLWPVSDAATAEWMTHFYEALSRGADVPLAAARARTAVASNPRWAHPRYWAGFVITQR